MSSKYDEKFFDRVYEVWREQQTKQYPEEDVERVFHEACDLVGVKRVRVKFADSPLAAWNRMKELEKPNRVQELWPLYWQAWACCYTVAREIGETVGKEETTYEEFAKMVPYFACGAKTAIISKNAVEIHFDEDGLMHRDDGPCAVYADGWKVWCINGNSVNEKIVMRPGDQTIEEIHNEGNEEVRRIRIDRFGWSRYLEESNSTVVELRRNEIEVTTEILADTPVGQRLLTFCPSTGRRYSLGIPGVPVKTCEEAQERLWGDKGILVVGRV